MSTDAVKKYVAAVNKTHKGLGNLSAFCILSAKANRCAVIIGVSGTGKTTAMESAISNNGKENIILDSVTRSGLEDYVDTLNGFAGSFVCRDLGSIDTSYSLTESLKVLAVLAYEHKITKVNAQTKIDIDNYNGSTMTTSQPIIMYRVMRADSWETVLQDKVTRYYHLLRPTNTSQEPIRAKIDWGIDTAKVRITSKMDKIIRKYIDDHVLQWSDGRSIQHLSAYLQALSLIHISEPTRPY